MSHSVSHSVSQSGLQMRWMMMTHATRARATAESAMKRCSVCTVVSHVVLTYAHSGSALGYRVGYRVGYRGS